MPTVTRPESKPPREESGSSLTEQREESHRLPGANARPLPPDNRFCGYGSANGRIFLDDRVRAILPSTTRIAALDRVTRPGRRLNSQIGRRRFTAQLAGSELIWRFGIVALTDGEEFENRRKEAYALYPAGAIWDVKPG